MKTIREFVVEMPFCSLLATAAVLVLSASVVGAADESIKEKAALCTPCHGPNREHTVVGGTT